MPQIRQLPSDQSSHLHTQAIHEPLQLLIEVRGIECVKQHVLGPLPLALCIDLDEAFHSLVHLDVNIYCVLVADGVLTQEVKLDVVWRQALNILNLDANRAG